MKRHKLPAHVIARQGAYRHIAAVLGHMSHRDAIDLCDGYADERRRQQHAEDRERNREVYQKQASEQEAAKSWNEYKPAENPRADILEACKVAAATSPRSTAFQGLKQQTMPLTVRLD